MPSDSIPIPDGQGPSRTDVTGSRPFMGVPLGGTHETRPALVGTELQVSLEIGGKEVEVQTFEAGEITVGRRPRNDIVIDGEGLKVVSGFHMQFRLVGGCWYAEDRDSTNGTYLNAEPLTSRVALKDGDVVELGRPRKVGSYRSVQLRVGLAGPAGADATKTSDLMLPHVTLTPSASSKAVPIPAVDATRIPEKLVRTGSSPTLGEASRLTSPVTKDAPALAPMELRALLEQTQRKSQRLGELTYRMEAYGAEFTAVVVRLDGTQWDSAIVGGESIAKALVERDTARGVLQRAEANLATLRLELNEKLEPLEKTAQTFKEASATAEAHALEALRASDESQAAFQLALTELRSDLKESLGPVADAAGEGSSTLEPTADSAGQSVWGSWASALQGGLDAISAQEESLSALGTKAELARVAAAKANEVEASCRARSTEAGIALEEFRSSNEADVAEKESCRDEASVAIEAHGAHLGSCAKMLCDSLLAGTAAIPGELQSFGDLETARGLFREAETLRRELAELA